MSKIITVCACSNCGVPVKIPITVLGQMIRKERKTEPTSDFMRKIGQKGRKIRAINKSKK